MCISMATMGAAASIGSTAMSVFGGMNAANQQEKQARIAAGDAAYKGFLQQDLNKLQAENETEAAQAQVDKIKMRAIAIRGTQVAQQAASGVVVGDGSAQDMVDKTTQLATSDVLAVLFSNANRTASLNASGRFSQVTGINQANAIIEQGDNAAFASRMGAAGSLLSGADKMNNMYEKGYLKDFGFPAPGRAA